MTQDDPIAIIALVRRLPISQLRAFVHNGDLDRLGDAFDQYRASFVKVAALLENEGVVIQCRDIPTWAELKQEFWSRRASGQTIAMPNVQLAEHALQQVTLLFRLFRSLAPKSGAPIGASSSNGGSDG